MKHMMEWILIHARSHLFFDTSIKSACDAVEREPAVYEAHFTGIPPDACEECRVHYLLELTAPAAIVHRHAGTTWFKASSDTRRMAEAWAQERSLLAIDLDAVRKRIDALYTEPATAISHNADPISHNAGRKRRGEK